MALKVSAGICEEGKTSRVRLGKTIESKGDYGLNDLLLRLFGNSVPLHALPQLHFNIAHAFFAALKTKSAPQLLGLPTAETSGNHRHPQKLLLEQRHPKCPF